jgi:hypothetical protein
VKGEHRSAKAPLWSKHPDIRQVTVVVVVVQTITNDKSIGNHKPAVVWLEWNGLPTAFAKENHGTDRLGSAILEVLCKGRQSLSRIEYVIQKQHISTRDIGRKRRVDKQCGCGRRRSAIAARLNQGNAERDADLAHQVSQRYQASRQDSYNGERLIPIVILDLTAYLLQASLDLRFAEQGFHNHDWFITSG